MVSSNEQVGVVIGHDGRRVGECVGQVFGLGAAPALARKSDASGDGKDCKGEEDEEQDAEGREGNCVAWEVVAVSEGDDD